MATLKEKKALETDREFHFTDADFHKLSKMVYERTGIVLKDHKKNMVYGRISRRLRQLDLDQFKDYLSLLEGQGGAAEIVNFVNAITTNLTNFYREAHHFEHLGKTVVPEAIEAMREQGTRRFRVWSAGCSSGQEPYTIAMTLWEHIPALAQYDARILATDLDTNCLDRGRSGIYPMKQADGIPSDCLKKYCQTGNDPEEGTVVMMGDKLKKLIAFKQLNLMGKWPMKGPFDAIFCRNVMIYFDNETKAELVRRLSALLKPRGWLYIGHSESLLSNAGDLELQGRTVYRRKN
ncbi:CheR family methyltransferase [Aestuariispira insulae]|uniref:Chemotaxis protein methyltransferase n=1 Tax=Aestuariispira insulae TaxID=1461337 RepID=A0A3D9HX42_9PROT|nr:protein-glutamate O-methyltransferase [Aestuariispira insulae]RED54073.1 CheR-type MCP methyltransferase [Aestuariispira insulae]